MHVIKKPEAYVNLAEILGLIPGEKLEIFLKTVLDEKENLDFGVLNKKQQAVLRIIVV